MPQQTPKSTYQRNPERGSAIFYVLTAIVLFAALSYAVSNMLKSGGSDVDREKVQLSAVEIIDYAGTIRRAIQNLKVSNGCSDEEISFEASNWSPATLYDNDNAPSDNSCHVFHPSGGGVPWQKAPNGEVYGFSGYRYIDDVGTTGSDEESRADLYLAVLVNTTLCKELNNQKDITNPSGNPPNIDETDISNRFTGTYDGSDAIVTSGDSATGHAATRGKQAFCGRETTNDNYYVHTLIAR